MLSDDQIKNILEAALLAAGGPLSLDRLLSLFGEDEQPERAQIRELLAELEQDYAGRGIEVKEVGSGWRIQVGAELAPWVSRLWEERPPRYSRALMETLALIAYRQPVTRGEIEDVRGVTVSTNIVKTLLEREWVRVVGHRDVPGKPALYATTREFLDYFGLASLEDLPTLSEIKDLESLNQELPFAEQVEAVADQSESGEGEQAADQYEPGEEIAAVGDPEPVHLESVEVSSPADDSMARDGSGTADQSSANEVAEALPEAGPQEPQVTVDDEDGESHLEEAPSVAVADEKEDSAEDSEDGRDKQPAPHVVH